MNDETPDTLHLPSFEDKVLAQLESVNGRLASLESRLASLEKRDEERDYDTKPIWNRVLTEISELKTEISELKTEVSELNKRMGNFDRKLDVMNKDVLQVKADLYGREMR